MYMMQINSFYGISIGYISDAVAVAFKGNKMNLYVLPEGIANQIAVYTYTL